MITFISYVGVAGGWLYLFALLMSSARITGLLIKKLESDLIEEPNQSPCADPATCSPTGKEWCVAKCQEPQVQNEPQADKDARVKKYVDRFLGWPLPSTVCSDPCATKQNEPHRSGTTLLTADEARQMFEYVLGDKP